MRNFITALLLMPIPLMGQIDMSKYVSGDLFMVKPIISLDDSVNLSYESKYPTRFQSKIQKGLDHLTNGELDDGLEVFEQMLDYYNTDPRINYTIGLIYYEKSQLEESKYHLEEVLKKDAFFLEARYFLGLIELSNNNKTEAKQHFEFMRKVPNYAALGLHGLGIIAYISNYINEAKGLWKRSLELNPSLFDVYRHLALAHLRLGSIKKAREVTEQALKIYPLWEEGLVMRAIFSLLQDSDTQQFEADLNQLIELSPKNYHYHSMRGYLQIELGNYSEATKNFKDAYDIRTDSVDIKSYKFESIFKKYEGFIHSFDYYYNHFDINPLIREEIDKGVCAMIVGSHKRAMSYFQEANKIEETSIAYTFIGTVQHARADDREKSIITFSKAIELDSTHWMAYSTRGKLYLHYEKTDSAYRDFSKVIELNPMRKDGFKNRGNILIQNGYYQQAYGDFSRALGLDPSDKDLLFNRALCSFKMKFYQNSEVDLNFIISKNPEYRDAYYMLYLNRMEQLDTIGAVNYLDSASKYSKYKNSTHKELLKLSKMKSLQQHQENAHDRLVKYNTTNYDLRMDRARFRYQIGMYKEAINDLKKVIRAVRRHGEAHYYIGMSLIKVGAEADGQWNLKRSQKFGFKPPDQ